MPVYRVISSDNHVIEPPDLCRMLNHPVLEAIRAVVVAPPVVRDAKGPAIVYIPPMFRYRSASAASWSSWACCFADRQKRLLDA